MSMILEDRSKNGTSTRSPESWFDVIRDVFKDYIGLDGLKLRRNNHYGMVIRYIIWLIIFLFCALFCFVLINALCTKWRQSSLVIVNADTLVPVHQIPFPAVTVCLETKSLPWKYNFTENYHLYNNSETRAKMSVTDREIFEDLTLVCDNHLNSAIGRKFSEPKDSVLNLMQVAPNITEAMLLCKWKHTISENCTVYFSQIMTEEGICFSFNMLEADDIFRTENLHSDYEYIMNENKKSSSWNLESGYSHTEKDAYPRRGSGYGANMGLVFLINQSKQDLDYLCRGPVQGVKVHLHNPAEFPRMSEQYFRTALSKESVVSIKPQMLTTAEALQSYPPERRQCYYPQERYLHYFKAYTQSNCEFECLTNHTNAKCGCVHIGMPRGPEMKVCNTGKVECMNEARNEFMERELDAVLNQGKHCSCLPPCTSISYDSEISQADYDFKALVESYRISFEEGVNSQLLVSRVKIFFKSSQFIASQRRQLYGAIDFLADCGGIIGLFMGISLLGLLKFVYIILLRIYYVSLGQSKWKESDQYEVVANSSSTIN